MRMYRSLLSFLTAMALSVMSRVAEVVEYCLAKFEPTVSAVVERICQTGHSLKTGIYSFSVKTAEGKADSMLSFISLRRSLDLSHTI